MDTHHRPPPLILRLIAKQGIKPSELVENALALQYDERQFIAALQRLLDIARSDTHQSEIVARFLLSLYNGDRFPFDLSDFRGLDAAIFQDCLLVLAEDKQPAMEVHRYFENGGQIWEEMAKAWRFKDHGLRSWQ